MSRSLLRYQVFVALKRSGANLLSFIEPEDSVVCLQEPATGQYPES